MRVALLVAILGLALVVTGVAFMYWPASLVVAGLVMVWAAFFWDWDHIIKGSKQ
jgi:hypothetical protein